MERQLEAPLLITSHSARRLRTRDVYRSLAAVNPDVPSSTAKTQIDRLIDALGVDCGEIQPAQSEANEQKRKAERLAARVERRRVREAELKAQEEEDLEGQVEDLGEEEGVGGDGEMENGGVEFDGEEGMDDRGDVEYGDVERDEDDDEPDHEDPQDSQGMEVDQW